jgi:hypothetical protein
MIGYWLKDRDRFLEGIFFLFKSTSKPVLKHNHPCQWVPGSHPPSISSWSMNLELKILYMELYLHSPFILSWHDNQAQEQLYFYLTLQDVCRVLSEWHMTTESKHSKINAFFILNIVLFFN